MDPDYFDPINQMCEVVMEEETPDESEPNKNESRDLPPVPRFDLQSEQFTYFPPPIVNSQPQALIPIHVEDISQPRKKLTLKPLSSLQAQPLALPEKKESKFVTSIIFSLPLIKKVYVSPDKGDKKSSLETEGADELKFYKEFFSDTSRVSLFRLHCTTCDKHIGCGSSALNIIKLHRTLLVLVCKRCYDFYGDDKFPTDKEDNTEVFCRWCGQGGKLVCCSYCPKVFCYKCINRNFNSSYLKEIEAVNDWACFFCAGKPLWPFRAIARALVQYMKQATVSEDMSECCKKRAPKEIATPKVVDQPMVAFNSNLMCPMSLTRPRPLNSSSNVGFMSDVFATARRLVAPSRPVLQRAPQAIRREPLQLFAPKPQLKSTRMSTPARTASSTRTAVPAKTAAPVKTAPPAKTAPPNQTESQIERPSKPRDVIVNHLKSNTTLVRVTNPGGRSQFFRIIVTGSCMKIPKSAVNPSFSEKSLEHAFQLGKMAFDRLQELNKASSNTSEAETAESLLSVLDGWKTLIGYVENDVKHNLDVFRNQSSKPMRWDFVSKCKGVFEQDSDIEIIEDESSEVQCCDSSLKRKNTDGEENNAKSARFDESVKANEDDTKLVNGDVLEKDNFDSSNEIEELDSSSNNRLSAENEAIDLDSSDSKTLSINDNEGTSSQKDESTEDVQTIDFAEDEEMTENETIKAGEIQMGSTQEDGEGDNTLDIGSEGPDKNAGAGDSAEVEDDSKIADLEDVTDREDGGNVTIGGKAIDCNKNDAADSCTDSFPLDVDDKNKIAGFGDAANREDGQDNLECDNNYREAEQINLENHEGISAEQTEEQDPVGLPNSKVSTYDDQEKKEWLNGADSSDCQPKNIGKSDDKEIKNCLSEAISDQISGNVLKASEQDLGDFGISEDNGQKDLSVSGVDSTFLVSSNEMDVDSPEFPSTECRNINNSQDIKLVVGDVDNISKDQQSAHDEPDIMKLLGDELSELGQAQNTTSDSESPMKIDQALLDDIKNIE